jgi:hypothetical protein
LYGGQVIAANPRIFAQMVKVLSPYKPMLAKSDAAKKSSVIS